MEHTPAKSSLKEPTTLSKPSVLQSAAVFEATAAGAGGGVSALFSDMALVSGEQAAGDTSLMMELDGILAEAQSLESYLKEKKKSLRQTLALICDKLRD